MIVLKRFFPLSLLLLSFFLVSPRASATHFMGVDISYQCLPNSNGCVFRIFHNTYYDCTGGATIALPGPPSSPTLEPFQPLTCTAPSPVQGWTFVSYTEVTPICPTAVTRCTSILGVINGVLEAQFYRDYDFCNTNCNVYNIVWRSCCRNSSVSSGASNDGIYSGETQINLSLNSCNSSPFFTSPPIPYICAGSGAIFDQGAFDPDGDSLAFTLSACMDDIGLPVGYGTGFSPTNPLGPSWQVSLSNQTGELIIVPNPGNVVTGVLCVTVKEYRNGVQIGSILRDMQVTVVSCPGLNQLPVVDSITLVGGGTQIAPNHYQVCEYDSLILAVAGSDADTAQLLKISSSSSIQGLQITSGSANPVTGTVRLASSHIGSHYIPILIEDDKCPIPGRSFAWIQVDVIQNCLRGSVTNSACGQAVGAIDITINGAGPYSYLWSTGDTTEDLTGLAPGIYSVTVTDGVGNVKTGTFTVNASNISLTATLVKPTCGNLNNGAVITAVSGGQAPYTYLWNTGATTSARSGLSAGGYSVTVTDANGCPRHQAFILDAPDSCFNVIEGVIFDDANNNCLMDAGEVPIPNMIVDLSPGGAVMTDLNGKYSFRVNTGTYTTQVYPRRWQNIQCPNTGIHSVTFNTIGNVQSNLDYAVYVSPNVDLAGYNLPPRVRPGTISRMYLEVRNLSNIPVSGGLNYEHDSLFSWVAVSPAVNSYDTALRTGIWNFTNLNPYQVNRYWVDLYNDSTTTPGTTFIDKVTVLPINGDSIPNNNTLLINGTVIAAYDPNDKQVSPAGIGPLGLIEQHEQQMKYTVRFQNTGNDTAFYVVIRDTIDTQKLDIFSFRSRMASHPYQLRIEDDKVLVFRFNNINLPDSTTNPSGSQGFVSFGLSHKNTLPIGARIENSAAIYFDFNDPIITNTILNTVFAYPALDLVADTTLCDGQPIQAVVSSPGLPPYTFNWSDGTTTNDTTGLSQTSVHGSGVYQVTVTDALGVTGHATAQVTAEPLADADFSVSPVGLDVTFNNTSTVNSTWLWDFGDGNTATGNLNQVHSYAQNGIYTVTLIVTNDCGSDTMTQEINLSHVAIDEVRFAQSVKLVPHPVQEVSYLRFANVDHEPFRLRILNLQGQVVREFGDTRGDVFEISRGNLAAGIYMYELVGTHLYFGKMVVK